MWCFISPVCRYSFCCETETVRLINSHKSVFHITRYNIPWCNSLKNNSSCIFDLLIKQENSKKTAFRTKILVIRLTCVFPSQLCLLKMLHKKDMEVPNTDISHNCWYYIFGCVIYFNPLTLCRLGNIGIYRLYLQMFIFTVRCHIELLEREKENKRFT